MKVDNLYEAKRLFDPIVPSLNIRGRLYIDFIKDELFLWTGPDKIVILSGKGPFNEDEVRIAITKMRTERP